MSKNEMISAPRELLERIAQICMFTMYKEDFRAISELLAKPAEQHQDEPKCETCKGYGVVGWTSGQTAESFEQGDSPCQDCDATGYAQSNGMPVPGACTACKGTGAEPIFTCTGDDITEGHDLLGKGLGRIVESSVVGDFTSDIPDFTPGNGNKAERRATELLAKLQADITARNELIDQLRSGYVFETGPYQVELSDAQWSAALGVFDNYNMGDDKHFVFLEEQGRGVISEILIEIGVARAPDADEVVE